MLSLSVFEAAGTGLGVMRAYARSVPPMRQRASTHRTAEETARRQAVAAVAISLRSVEMPPESGSVLSATQQAAVMCRPAHNHIGLVTYITMAEHKSIGWPTLVASGAIMMMPPTTRSIRLTTFKISERYL
jgi:hypothetical protein